MANQCIFCSKVEDLTISMQVTTSKGISTVWICNEHEDDASPKKVRELVEKKNLMIEEFEKQAKELGYTLVPMGKGGLIEAAKAIPTPSPSPAPSVDQDSPKLFAPTVRAKKIMPIVVPTVAKTSTGQDMDLGSHQSYDTTQSMQTKKGTIEAPIVTEHEEQVIMGRDGKPMVIPKKVVGNTGTTDVTIVNTGGDKALQARLKQAVQASIVSKSACERALMAGGYSARECPLCKGCGITKINNQQCVKCGGTGTI
jgi:hypothetical protein